MSAIGVIQSTDSLARRHVFSMPMWLLCNCSRICFCTRNGIIIYLFFIVMPLIMVCSCLIDEYFSSLSSSASLVCVHPLIIYLLSICNSTSSSVAVFMSSMDVHVDTSTTVLMVCILAFLPVISWSWFSTWLWCDSQSTINLSGPCLYHPCTLYWCRHSMMYCKCWDNVMTSLMIMATSGSWSVMTCTSFPKE